MIDPDVGKILVASASFGVALGSMISELRHKKKQITAFNGEKQEIIAKLNDLTDEAIRRTTEQSNLRKRLVKVESHLKLHHYRD